MSRVTFIEPIANAVGKIKKSSHVSHRTTFGVQHTYYWNPENIIRPTFGRLIHRESLAEASHQASVLLAAEDANGPWHIAYRQSDYAGPINSFIVRRLMPDIKARLAAEWKDKPLSQLQSYIARQSASRTKKN